MNLIEPLARLPKSWNSALKSSEASGRIWTRSVCREGMISGYLRSTREALTRPEDREESLESLKQNPLLRGKKKNSPKSEMDNSWPRRRIQARRGRSDQGYTFHREPLGPSIHSRHPYAFADSLAHQNWLVMDREDSDPIYRGDVRVTTSNLRGESNTFGSRFSESTPASVCAPWNPRHGTSPTNHPMPAAPTIPMAIPTTRNRGGHPCSRSATRNPRMNCFTKAAPRLRPRRLQGPLANASAAPSHLCPLAAAPLLRCPSPSAALSEPIARATETDSATNSARLSKMRWKSESLRRRCCAWRIK